jgi:hypothetical protein
MSNGIFGALSKSGALALYAALALPAIAGAGTGALSAKLQSPGDEDLEVQEKKVVQANLRSQLQKEMRRLHMARLVEGRQGIMQGREQRG